MPSDAFEIKNKFVKKLPDIPPNARVEVDADGGRTYRFSVCGYEISYHTIYISKDQLHVVEEIEAVHDCRQVKYARRETWDGLKHGIQESYDNKGCLLKREEYSHGVKNGLYEYYDTRSGKIWEKGQYKDGKREGVWKHYLNGVCNREISYSNGKYNGAYKDYLTTGGERVLYEKKYYINGNLSGMCESYSNGKLYSKTGYLDGKKDGVHVRYFLGKPSVVGEYSNGKKTGEWTHYFTDNLVLRVEHFKDGKRHGICQECYYRYTKGVGLEIDYVEEYNYINGVRDGEFPYEEFNQNGELVLKGSLINNKKEDIWKHYQNNELVSQDFYFAGELINTIKSNIKPVDNKKNAGVYDLKNMDFKCKEIQVKESDTHTDRYEGDIIYKYGSVWGIKNGLYQSFDCNEHLVEEGYYLDEKKVGIWRSYYEDGSLSKEVPYVDGVISGIIKNYFDGELVERIYVSGDKFTETCPYERYYLGEITEQGECTIETEYGPYKRNEKVIQRYRHGKPQDEGM
ncbi:MAG: hypothetical protein IKS41_02035 [Alphaproteobacteria bacterium]|nr:hypothetical protein [Alphaproteobacteria bacterium]